MTSLKLLLCAGLVSAAVSAAPVSVTVGEKKVVKVSMPIARANSSDAATLGVRRLRAKEIEILGRVPGRATLVMKTVGGSDVTLDIHVLSEGSHVYSAQR